MMRRMPALAMALGAVSIAVVTAYKEGPAPAMTGGFGEPNCTKCHFDNALNDRRGSLSIDGIPAAFVAGREYPLTVTLRRAGLARGGFELSARYAPGSADAGRQAGTLRPRDGRMQIVSVPGGAVQYIQHTKTGSAAATRGMLRWTFTWIAPAASHDASRAVEFDLAGNASNDDASPLGDFVYVLSKRSRSAGK